MFDEKNVPELSKDSKAPITWPAIVQKVLNAQSDDAASLKAATIAAWSKVGYKFSPEEEKKLLSSYEWFGIYDKATPVIRRDTVVDSLCALLEERLKLQPTDRDMVVLQHRFVFELANGKIVRVFVYRHRHVAGEAYINMHRLWYSWWIHING